MEHPAIVVTAAIIEHDNKILLTRRPVGKPYGKMWEFPGGKVELAEDPKDCIVREIREELDMSVEVVSVVDTVFHRYPEKAVLLIAYRCRWLGGGPRNIDVDAHEWVVVDQLLAYDLLPADIPLAHRLRGAAL